MAPVRSDAAFRHFSYADGRALAQVDLLRRTQHEPQDEPSALDTVRHRQSDAAAKPQGTPHVPFDALIIAGLLGCCVGIDAGPVSANAIALALGVVLAPRGRHCGSSPPALGADSLQLT